MSENVDVEDGVEDRKTVAVCRECLDLVMPFGNPMDALDWAQRHRDGTGHDVRTVSGWPSEDEAIAKAFPS